eukprot:TRINITY_DN2069_c0_g1_i5.p1 TRINITY_DN2069_c0_g1~~TRINITY_DN2069_c0_g1_i5.p1  ORF type:complete len:138 (+),score=23.24 TRINITY_DN2069_c0_g1_i5:122-535(+)
MSKRGKDLKICILGDAAVGKSSLALRFTHGSFVDTYDPTIEDSCRKEVDLDGQVSVVDILDTAGQDEFASMMEQWMKDNKGFLFVYNITAKSSFHQAKVLYERLAKVKEGETFAVVLEIGRAVQQECRDRSRMPSSA